MMRQFKHLFPFNASFEAELAALDATCGFTAFLDEHLVFPPKGARPPAPSSDGACDMYDTLTGVMYLLNPCFSTYHIASTCPYAVDPITNPPGDGVRYFNLPAVQAALNAPPTAWRYCRGGVYTSGNTDLTVPPSPSVLPRAIERLNRTLIVSGTLDLTLPSNGTLLAIQNITWGGAHSFTRAPAGEFFVPYTGIATDGEADGSVASLAGTGLKGTLHAERGLVFVDVFLAGHKLPQW
ncbi:Alpha/Beta hydrolase protein [Mycena sp. CBHHK59/15]|nr:Alpha/Beta hydrolase protein [Mycena sp. CBHHK59/15]